MSLIPRRALALARKELLCALNSPATYGVIAFFLIFTSLWFFYAQRFFALDIATLRPYFVAFPAAITIVVPALTMRSWAEERRTGTDELLLTLPFTEWDLVLGKFLSNYAVFLIATLLTVPTPLSLLPLGRFDGGVIISEYLGVILLGAAAVSLGLFCASLADNQVGSFLGSLLALLAATFAHRATAAFNLPPALSDFVTYFSLAFHFESFAKGVLDTRGLGFFILSSGFMLFLSTRVVLYRRWGKR